MRCTRAGPTLAARPGATGLSAAKARCVPQVTPTVRPSPERLGCGCGLPRRLVEGAWAATVAADAAEAEATAAGANGKAVGTAVMSGVFTWAISACSARSAQTPGATSAAAAAGAKAGEVAVVPGGDG